MMRLTQAEILDEGSVVKLTWDEGREARFHALWLRDNALDESTRSPANGQRLRTVLDIDPALHIDHAVVTADDALQIRFAPEAHETQFSGSWLADHAYDKTGTSARGWIGEEKTLWDVSLEGEVPTVDYARARENPSELAAWLAAIERYGFAVMRGCPTESGSLVDVTELFGFVRETNYGRWFDVRAEVNPNNLAYTNLGLQAHTDNPYRDPVPTLQILSCLENSVEGGESMVVDGFAVARKIQEENSEWFDVLAVHPARFAYAGSAGTRLESKRPMIELGPDGEMLSIRFNNRSAAPITDVPFDQMALYYDAYRRFAELVEDPQMSVTFRLEQGELFIVDNTRVLHARTAFSGTGNRWLQGCYADKDGLSSTRRAIEAAAQ